MLSDTATARELDDFHMDSQARTLDFFEAWKRELPPKVSETVDKIADGFFQHYAVPRLHGLFGVLRSDAEKVVSAAGGGEGYCDTMEQMSGFRFRLPEAPQSASLVPKSQQSMDMGFVRGSHAAEPEGTHCTGNEFINQQSLTFIFYRTQSHITR